MPIPFLETLSSAARLAYPAIVRGVREGLSARAIGTAIRSVGLAISNDALFEIARREREIFTHGQSLRFLNLDSMPNPFRLPESLTRLARQFAFTAEVRQTIAGALVKSYITISTNENMSRREIEELAADIASKSTGPSGAAGEVEEVILTGGLRAGALGTL